MVFRDACYLLQFVIFGQWRNVVASARPLRYGPDFRRKKRWKNHLDETSTKARRRILFRYPGSPGTISNFIRFSIGLCADETRRRSSLMTICEPVKDWPFVASGVDVLNGSKTVCFLVSSRNGIRQMRRSLEEVPFCIVLLPFDAAFQPLSSSLRYLRRVVLHDGDAACHVTSSCRVTGTVRHVRLLPGECACILLCMA